MNYTILSIVEFIAGFYIVTFTFTFKCNESDDDIVFEQSIFVTDLDTVDITIQEYIMNFTAEFCSGEEYANMLSAKLESLKSTINNQENLK